MPHRLLNVLFFGTGVLDNRKPCTKHKMKFYKEEMVYSWGHARALTIFWVSFSLFTPKPGIADRTLFPSGCCLALRCEVCTWAVYISVCSSVLMYSPLFFLTLWSEQNLFFCKHDLESFTCTSMYFFVVQSGKCWETSNGQMLECILTEICPKLWTQQCQSQAQTS